MQKDIKASLKAYNEQYARDRISQDRLDSFCEGLIRYVRSVREAEERHENEEYYKKLLNVFLETEFYSADRFTINTSGNIDSAIRDDGNLRVIIEAKSIQNRNEFPRGSTLLCKGLYELFLYYLRATRDVSGDRVKPQYGVEIRRLILSNSIEWYFFDANDFEKLCVGELELKYFKYANSQLNYKNSNQQFYDEIADYLLSKQVDNNLDFVKINLSDYINNKGNLVRSANIDVLYKVFDYHFLLKESYRNSGKTHVLNTHFYEELLYIMGLKEKKEKGKILIVLDHTIENSIGWQLYKKYTEDKEYSPERSTEGTLELMILWINRLLFIKLFEGQLISFNEDTIDYHILSQEKIHSFKDLQNLFFKVLGRRVRDDEAFYQQFSEIPYLNSSLFERQTIEKDDFNISDLANNEVMIAPRSVLNRRRVDRLPLLDYIISFLSSYDFGASGTEQGGIRQGRDIIDASVLGLIFEKINGYKDGSFYTPSYITEHIAKEVIEKLVVNKMNIEFGWNCSSYENLVFHMSRNATTLDVIDRANAVINNLRIVDPAVGSGHFLVSALNRLIAIKHDLGIIKIHGEDSRMLSNVDIYISDDTLNVSDPQGNIFRYNKNDRLSQNVQETLFEEKKTIIQNCLFGVDINQKAVAICQLRLWIELLKNAYYKNGVMETLPNIDINIKRGNSLVSTISYKLGNVIGTTNNDNNITIPQGEIRRYRELVADYRCTAEKSRKAEITQSLKTIKHRIKAQTYHQGGMIIADGQWVGIDYGENVGLYNEAFEWGIEFPEVVSDDGRYKGFDCVIGNPPYGVSLSDDEKKYYKKTYNDVHVRTPDSYNYFISLGLRLLKNSGTIAYIVPNTLLYQNEYEKARKLLIKENYLTSVINLGDNVFDRADVPTCIVFADKEHKESYDIPYADFRDVVSDDLPLGKYDTVLHSESVLDTPSYVLGVDDFGKQILDIVKNKSTPLSDIVLDVSAGISTGNNKVFCISSDFATHSDFEQDLLKRMLAGKDIDSYEIHWDDKYMIYSTKDTDTPSHKEIYKYLLPFKNDLSKKRETKKGLIPWYSLHWPRYQELFLGPKIVIRQTSDRIRAAFDDNNYYALNSLIVLKLNLEKKFSYFFVLSVLNSRLSNCIYMLLTQEKGRGFAEVKPINIRKLYVPSLDEDKLKEYEDIVKRIMNGDLSKTEGMRIIDGWLYDYYEFTDSQREYIESFIN